MRKCVINFLHIIIYNATHIALFAAKATLTGSLPARV